MTAARKDPQDHLRGKKRPVTKVVYISNDPGFEEQLERVQEELSRIKNDSMMSARMSDMHEERRTILEKQEREMVEELRKEHSIKFTFRSIGMKKFDALVSDHPATDAAREKAKEAGQNPDNLQYNPETFHPALLKAALVDPVDFDIEAVFESDDWNDQEIAALVTTAINANMTRRVVPLGNG